MKSYSLTINKFYIIEDCEIKEGDNIIANDDSYTSALDRAMFFDSYEEAIGYIYEINPYYNAEVRIVYQVANGDEVTYMFYPELKEFLNDFSNEI
jgi:hypothetical protein